MKSSLSQLKKIQSHGEEAFSIITNIHNFLTKTGRVRCHNYNEHYYDGAIDDLWLLTLHWRLKVFVKTCKGGDHMTLWNQ